MKTENKLIADFMGMTAHHQDKGCMIFMTPQGHNDIVYVNDLKYHTSWDWLMTVVEKIFSIAVKDENIEVFYEVVNNIPDRHETYKSVVKFINEYKKD